MALTIRMKTKPNVLKNSILMRGGGGGGTVGMTGREGIGLGCLEERKMAGIEGWVDWKQPCAPWNSLLKNSVGESHT